MYKTKEEIITIYHEIKEELVRSPTSKEFYEKAKISQRILEKFYGSNPFGKLMAECGDTPYRFGQEKTPLEEILIKYGELCRQLKKHPVEADWKFHNYRPSVSGITQSHKIKWGEMPRKFYDFAIGRNEWADVLNYLPNSPSKGVMLDNSENRNLASNDSNFIPPIVQSLITYSFDEKKYREFEQMVNLTFEMLGFEVISYGQGSGRNPDGIAKENQLHYAILMDAKARKDGYKFGTEDRKFIEYIKTHLEPLRKSGFSKIYFLIISSKFENISQKAIENIKIETQVPIALITSRLLLKILSKKIEKPRLFNLRSFENLLINDGEIDEGKIQKFINNLR